MGKLKIFGVPGSHAARVLWYTNQLGLEYENVAISFADQMSKTPEHLKIDPIARYRRSRTAVFT
jgi:glutathione S-transferase